VNGSTQDKPNRGSFSISELTACGGVADLIFATIAATGPEIPLAALYHCVIAAI